MPPSVRFSKDAVLNAACQLVRREGPSALNARAVARELGGSTQPIFRLFSGMEDLKAAMIQMVSDSFYAQLYQRMDASPRPYLAMGMWYLTFATEEPQLFKLLFMRDRVTDGCYCKEQEAYAALYQRIAKSMGITPAQAEGLYARSWTYTHGLAVAIATKYIPPMSESAMEAVLTESCQAAAAQMNLTLAS